MEQSILYFYLAECANEKNAALCNNNSTVREIEEWNDLYSLHIEWGDIVVVGK